MAHTTDEVEMARLKELLTKAGGANYDAKQNAAAAEPTDAFASMKDTAARRFGEIEKTGNVKGLCCATGSARCNPLLTLRWRCRGGGGGGPGGGAGCAAA
jgi:hypothetical protein